jgi:drug/metabolite transporter (DMT)-like permease
MWQLVVVSLVWAFSPGLIKTRLTGLGGIDSSFIATARLALALVVFLPFIRVRGLTRSTLFQLVVIGALQFGVMYLCYNEAFRYLNAYEVLLCTITTPLFVTLLNDALDRKLRLTALAAALLAAVGAAVAKRPDAALRVQLLGFTLMQVSNLAFAGGQVWYQRMRARQPALRDRDVFAWLYLGATMLAAVVLVARDVTITLHASQLLTLAYLGVIASGLGFFLWNVGATRVSAATLAVMNNAKIPLGVACSLLFFHEAADLGRLILGGSLMVIAVWLAGRTRSNASVARTRP